MGWTLLVFMAADNDLGTVAPLTIDELIRGARSVADPGAVEILGQVDLPGIGAERWRIGSGPGARREDEPRLGRVNTGDPKVLGEFLDWAQAKRSDPYGHCALVVWNHGGGTLGVDDGAHRDYLTNNEFRRALTTEGNGAKIKIDLLGCDACLTATLELAFKLHDLASYYVAPETNTPKRGWSYEAIVRTMARDPDMAPRDLANVIVESFMPAPNEVLGAWNLAQVGALVEKLGEVGDDLQSQMGDPTALRKARDQMIAMEDPDYVDLADCLNQLGNDGLVTQGHATKALAALAAARVVKTAGGVLGGLSVLFPQDNSHWVASRRSDRPTVPFRANLAGLGNDHRWTDFLKAYARRSN